MTADSGKAEHVVKSWILQEWPGADHLVDGDQCQCECGKCWNRDKEQCLCGECSYDGHDHSARTAHV